jgi:hypothetical protein
MKKGIIITAVVLALGISMPAGVYAGNLSSDNASMVAQSDEVKYDKIDVSEVPETVSSSITQDYAGYEISKAFVGDDGSYKVKLKSDSEKVTVFYDSQGQFLRTEEDRDDDEDADGGWFDGGSQEGDTLNTNPDMP